MQEHVWRLPPDVLPEKRRPQLEQLLVTPSSTRRIASQSGTSSATIRASRS